MKRNDEQRQRLKRMLSGQSHLDTLATTWQKKGDPYCLYNPENNLWYSLQASIDADKPFTCIGLGIERNIPWKGMEAYRMPNGIMVFF